MLIGLQKLFNYLQQMRGLYGLAIYPSQPTAAAF
jgi:hypothetical protein